MCFPYNDHCFTSIVVSGSLNRWDRKTVYTTYSPCQLGDSMLPIPTFFKGTRSYPIDFLQQIFQQKTAGGSHVDWDLEFSGIGKGCLLNNIMWKLKWVTWNKNGWLFPVGYYRQTIFFGVYNGVHKESNYHWGYITGCLGYFLGGGLNSQFDHFAPNSAIGGASWEYDAIIIPITLLNFTWAMKKTFVG